VTIPSHNQASSRLFAWRELHAADFNFHSPFQLALAEGELLSIEKIIRVIPKRRMVGFCVWQGKPAVIKLFFDEQHARRQMEKDAQGISVLHAHHTPTPSLYYQGVSQDRRVYILIFERILQAESLEDIWRRRSQSSPQAVLERTVIELATQHVFGVMQRDLHLKNFLCTEQVIYTLDGGKVELQPSLLDKKMSMECLAIFIAQLGVGVEALQEHLFRIYAKARGYLWKESDKLQLFFLIKQWNEKRWKNFSKKIFRNSTDFAVIKKGRWQGMHVRKYASQAWKDFYSQPDAIFEGKTAQLLKDGRSSTVIKVSIDERDYVIKRYNMKSIWHFMRRCFRATRARTAWRLANKLQLFCIPTATPIAFIESRVLGLRGKSYYVTEYVAGEHAGQFFAHQQDEIKIHAMVKRIIALLKSLAKLHITHGDFKVSNVLISAHEQPVLIDLDAAIEHASLSSLHRTWHYDIERFTRDLDRQSVVREYFEREL